MHTALNSLLSELDTFEERFKVAVQQKQVEALIGELSEERARRLGMERRDFLRSSMGMATAFLASNMVYGPHWQVSAEETVDRDAADDADGHSCSLDTLRQLLHFDASSAVDADADDDGTAACTN